MIRRIQKTNDLRDIFISCPRSVINDIHTLKYYVEGHEDIVITPSFDVRGDTIVAVLPSQELENLPDGILYRKAIYKKSDTRYPDETYDLEMVDCLNVWLLS